MDLASLYRSEPRMAADAAALIPSGAKLSMGMAMAEPPANDNRFFHGDFQELGRKLAVADIHCPVFLLAGEDDDITPPIQVHNTAKRPSTPPDQVEARTVTGAMSACSCRTRRSAP